MPGRAAPDAVGPARADPPAIDTDVGAAALDWLLRRHSVGPKHLSAPAPLLPVLQQAAALAERAPDHGGLRPFRFVRVPDGRRAALAALFEADARRRGLDAEAVARAGARAHNGPALLALLVRLRAELDDVPEHEQWLCAGAALMNFLDALHLQGYAAKVLSGASVRDAAIRQAFCDPDERLAAWIVAGTAARRPQPRPPAAERGRPLLSDWG